MISREVIWVLNGMFAEMKTTDPYSPKARASASAEPVTRAGSTVGMITRLKVCQRVAPKAACRFFNFQVEVFEYRLNVAYDEWESNKGQCQQNSGRRECHLNSQRHKISPEPSIFSIDRGKRQPCDGSGKCKWQIHDGIDQPLTEEVVTRKDPCDEKTKHRIDCGSRDGRTNCELIGCNDLRRSYGRTEMLPAASQLCSGTPR